LSQTSDSQDFDKNEPSKGGETDTVSIPGAGTTVPMEEVEKILAGSGLDEEGEPDSETLTREEKKLAEIKKEAPQEILEDPKLAVEISDDPVRLYLKEIGGIDLLNPDQEFWLATQIEAARRVDYLSRQHPQIRKGDSLSQGIYKALYEEMMTAWKRVVEDTVRLGFDLPDLCLILGESQMLRQTWAADSPSYLHAYLGNGMWGKDPLWDGVARNAFTVFVSLYLLPDPLSSAICPRMMSSRLKSRRRALELKMPIMQ
jgi:RNA polymerase primary sigma factor